MSNKATMKVDIEKLIDEVSARWDDMHTFYIEQLNYKAWVATSDERVESCRYERSSFHAGSFMYDISSILGIDMERLYIMVRTVRKWNEKCNYQFCFPYKNCAEQIAEYLKKDANDDALHYPSTGRRKKYVPTSENKYYFTFGNDKDYPYQGGWVEVYAANLQKAQHKFRAQFPDRTKGVLNCADFYTEEHFLKSGMRKDNLGKRCHEVIR